MSHSFQMLALTSLAICAWGEVSGLIASSRVKIGADPLLALQQNSWPRQQATAGTAARSLGGRADRAFAVIREVA